jgi:diaminopropionate ammonia-lyase
VREAARQGAANQWQIVSDTSWPGYREVPVLVMHGYMVCANEILDQISALQLPSQEQLLPTHIFLQGGVGGLAAAVIAAWWEALGPSICPTFVIVEPDRADCLFQSARAGKPTPARGDLDTVMAGLSCGEVSQIAWPIILGGASTFITVDDADAIQALRLLGRGVDADPAIIAGESAVAGVAALLALGRDDHQRELCGLNDQSRVLVIGTEGATDPDLYRALMAGDAAT